MFNIEIKIFFLFFCVLGSDILIAAPIGKLREKGTVGLLLSNIAISGYKPPIGGGDYGYRENDRTGAYRGFSNKMAFGIFYNISTSQQIVFRSFIEKERTYGDTVVSPPPVLGFLKYEVFFKNFPFEISYKFYPLEKNFYVAPVFGFSSAKRIRFDQDLPSLILPIALDNFAPVSFSYDINANPYGGLDFGYSFAISNSIFINFGYVVKYRQKGNIRYQKEFRYGFVSSKGWERSLSELLVQDYISRAWRNDLAGIADGATSLYLEAGFLF